MPSVSQEIARRVLEIEAQAIQDLLARIDASFDRAVEILFACAGRVSWSRAWARAASSARRSRPPSPPPARRRSSCTPPTPSTATSGRVVKGDVVLALSYSGETAELLALRAPGQAPGRRRSWP